MTAMAVAAAGVQQDILFLQGTRLRELIRVQGEIFSVVYNQKKRDYDRLVDQVRGNRPADTAEYHQETKIRVREQRRAAVATVKAISDTVELLNTTMLLEANKEDETLLAPMPPPPTPSAQTATANLENRFTQIPAAQVMPTPTTTPTPAPTPPSALTFPGYP